MVVVEKRGLGWLCVVERLAGVDARSWRAFVLDRQVVR